jgi:hypothetical protein
MGADQHPHPREIAVSWLTFLLIAGGIVAAGFAAAVLLLGRADRGALRVAAGAVLALAAVAVAFPVAKTSVRNINGVRLDNRGTPPNHAKEKCVVDGGAADIVPLIERLRADLPAKAQYQVIGPLRTDFACLNTNMLPRTLVDTPRAGDWLVFTEGVPADARRRLQPGSLRQVTDKLAFGQVR